MTAAMLKLSFLRFGHDPLAGPEINARRSGRLEGIEEMAAMLSTGQIERMLVVLNPMGSREGEGLYFVINGNRRLAAMNKHWKPDADVMVEIAPDAKRALEMSLMTASLPLHPVDRFRAYREVMKRDKIDAIQLARRFGMQTKDMEKALALGGLCEEVLDAWLSGAINADAAKVFTLAPDKKTQQTVLAAALKGQDYKREPDQLRTAIMGKRKDVSSLVAFAGVDAYRKAGGKLEEDLFGTKHVAHNPEIAVKLANEKLDGVCQDLATTGWAWAVREDKMPQNWRHSLGYGHIDKPRAMAKLGVDEEKERLALVEAVDRHEEYSDERREAEGELKAFDSVVWSRSYPTEKMKLAGCVVSITDTGRLEIEHGWLKPEEKKAAAKAAKTKEKAKAKKLGEPAKPATIPAALASDLSAALTRAAAATIVGGDPALVLAIAVAALAAGADSYSSAVRLEHKGMLSGQDESKGVEFEDALKEARKLPLEGLIAKLSRFVGMAFNLQSASHDRSLVDPKDEPDVVALLGALPPSVLQLQLRKEFDAVDFFNRAPGAIALAALADMGAEAPKGAKKAAIAKLAADAAPSRGWLPPTLRTKDYTGAQAKPKAPAKPAKKAPGKKKRL